MKRMTGKGVTYGPDIYMRLRDVEDILGDEYDLDLVQKLIQAYREGRYIIMKDPEQAGVSRLRELAQADREGRCVVLNMPRKPLVWGDDDQNTCLCFYCGRDLMGIPYGERMVLQCPECGQYLDATKVITRAEAQVALRREQDEQIKP